MKKFVRIFSLILSVVMAFSLFVACGDENGSNNQNSTTISKVSNSSKVELYNFEQWKPDFSTIKIQKLFGKVKWFHILY